MAVCPDPLAARHSAHGIHVTCSGTARAQRKQPSIAIHLLPLRACFTCPIGASAWRDAYRDTLTARHAIALGSGTPAHLHDASERVCLTVRPWNLRCACLPRDTLAAPCIIPSWCSVGVAAGCRATLPPRGFECRGVGG